MDEKSILYYQSVEKHIRANKILERAYGLARIGNKNVLFENSITGSYQFRGSGYFVQLKHFRDHNETLRIIGDPEETFLLASSNPDKEEKGKPTVSIAGLTFTVQRYSAGIWCDNLHRDYKRLSPPTDERRM